MKTTTLTKDQTGIFDIHLAIDLKTPDMYFVLCPESILLRGAHNKNFKALTMKPTKEYTSFAEFYPFYLSQHADKTNRRLHFCGTLLLLSIALTALFTQHYMLFLAVPLAGYGFAWVGHFFFEKNRPATFTYPFYSLMGDFVMFWHMLTGKIRF